MKNKVLVRFSNCFLFILVGFLTLFSPFAGFGQKSSNSINLGGEWKSKPYSTHNIYDNSLIDVTFTYTFDNQGKVTLYIFTYKGAGSKLEPIQTSPTYDPQINSPFEQRMVLTPATTSSKIEIGTYKISGKSIYLEFPTYTLFN